MSCELSLATGSPMRRAASYSESQQLSHLIERLRERLGADPLPTPRAVEHLEEVLARLVMRERRLRVLRRLTCTSDLDEHLEAMCDDLERMDAELLEELPGLLERLHGRS